MAAAGLTPDLNVADAADEHFTRQSARKGCAKRNGFEIVDSYYDAAVPGADPIHDRPGFTALLDRKDGNGVRTVIVESPAGLPLSEYPARGPGAEGGGEQMRDKQCANPLCQSFRRHHRRRRN